MHPHGCPKKEIKGNCGRWGAVALKEVMAHHIQAAVEVQPVRTTQPEQSHTGKMNEARTRAYILPEGWRYRTCNVVVLAGFIFDCVSASLPHWGGLATG